MCKKETIDIAWCQKEWRDWIEKYNYNFSESKRGTEKDFDADSIWLFHGKINGWSGCE